MTAVVTTKRERDEIADRAESIASWAATVASVVADAATLVSEHADTIAGWTLALRRSERRNVRS